MHRLACSLFFVLAPVLASAQPAPDSPEAPPPALGLATVAVPAAVPPPVADQQGYAGEPWALRVGAFVQPQFRLRQDSPAPFDEDGFRMARARVTATGAGKAGNLDLSAYFEAELQPTFSLYDAYVTVARALPGKGVVALDLGQTRVPISRQQLLSDTRIAFVDKAQLATIAPDRDLGLRAWYRPSQLPQVRVIGGVFNGEGRDQVQNINQSYLWAGRVEITPIGDVQPYAESAFYGDWLSLGLSIGHNRLSPGDFIEKQLSLGVDVSGSYRGLSGSFEYLEVRHDFTGDNPPGVNYHANGFTAQVNYMLPIGLPPYREARFEVGARVEEIDRNDQVPIVMVGDPNQSQRIYTAVLSYYLRQHLLKAQLALSKFQEIEDRTAIGGDASYPNDQLLLQITYRVE